MIWHWIISSSLFYPQCSLWILRSLAHHFLQQQLCSQKKRLISLAKWLSILTAVFGLKTKPTPYHPCITTQKEHFWEEFCSSGSHLLQGEEKNSITKVDMLWIWGAEIMTNLLILYFYPVLEKSKSLTSPLGIEQETFTSAFPQSASMQEEKQLFPPTFITIPTFPLPSPPSLLSPRRVFLYAQIPQFFLSIAQDTVTLFCLYWYSGKRKISTEKRIQLKNSSKPGSLTQLRPGEV